MADNTTLNAGTGGDVIATDDIAGVKHQRVKIEYGGDGSATDVSNTSGLPVTAMNASSSSGNITAAAQTVALTVGGLGGCGIQIAGTWSGTLVFESTVNGTDYQAHSVITSDEAARIDQTTGNGIWFTGVAGTNTFRVRASAFASGTATITLLGTDHKMTGALFAPIPAGGNAIGTLAANDGVDIGDVTVNNAGGGSAVPIQDGGNSITVDYGSGTFVVNQTNQQTLDYDSGAGTVTTTIQGIALPSAGGPVAGGTATDPLRVDTTGTTTQPVSDAGGSLTVDNPALSVTGGGTQTGALRVTLASDSTGVVSVDDNGGSLTVDDGGTSLTVDGTVSVNLNAGTNTNEVVGDAAHDAVAAGNPLLVGAYADTPADSAPGQQVSADGDVARVAVDRDGAVFTNPHPPRIWHASNEFTTAQTDATVKAAPGAGLSLYIDGIYLATNAAVDITLEEGTTTLKWKYYSGGQGDGASVQFKTPIKLSANTALTVTSSSAVTFTLVVTGHTGP